MNSSTAAADVDGSLRFHAIQTPQNRLYVHRKYGVETKEPTTSATVQSTNLSIDTSGWITMAAEKA
jgi:hypothetical protein